MSYSFRLGWNERACDTRRCRPTHILDMANRDEEHIGEVLAKFRRENGIPSRRVVAERMRLLGEKVTEYTLYKYVRRVESFGQIELRSPLAESDSTTRLRNYLTALNLTGEQVEFLREQKTPGSEPISEALREYRPYSPR